MKRIVIHCSATRRHMDIGAKEIRQWHLDRGWDDIGYHVIIRRDGRLEFGRPFDVAGAHVRGYNRGSIGVCLVGGLDGRALPAPDYSEAQWAVLRRLVDALLLMFPGAEVMGHRDLDSGKDCPCFDVRGWLDGTTSS